MEYKRQAKHLLIKILYTINKIRMRLKYSPLPSWSYTFTHSFLPGVNTFTHIFMPGDRNYFKILYFSNFFISYLCVHAPLSLNIHTYTYICTDVY